MKESIQRMIDERIKQIEYEGKPSDVDCVLNMLDKKHAIVLHNEIGLLGEHDFYVNKMIENHGVLHIPARYPGEFERVEEKRGENFQVLSRDGLILFDLLVNHIAIMYDKKFENRFYLFVLSDYKSFNELDMMLGDIQDGMVLYRNGKLYHNNIQGVSKEQLGVFDGIMDIKRRSIAYNTYSVTINDEIYVSFGIKSRANNIWEYHSNPKINI